MFSGDVCVPGFRDHHHPHMSHKFGQSNVQMACETEFLDSLWLGHTPQVKMSCDWGGGEFR